MPPPAIRYPKPPAQVDVYVDGLGPRKTVEFLLTFGGAVLDLSRPPTDRSRVVQLVGSDKARELAEQKHRMQARVPLAKKWLAACLRAEGAFGQRYCPDTALHRCECPQVAFA